MLVPAVGNGRRLSQVYVRNAQKNDDAKTRRDGERREDGEKGDCGAGRGGTGSGGAGSGGEGERVGDGAADVSRYHSPGGSKAILNFTPISPAAPSGPRNPRASRVSRASTNGTSPRNDGPVAT